MAPRTSNGPPGSSGARFSVLKRSSTHDVVGGFGDMDELRERGAGGGRDPRLTLMPKCADFKWIDQFPYYPAYRYYSYRSFCGAASSTLFLMILFLRIISSISDFVGRPPIVTEAREQFPRDSAEQHSLPRIGVQFRQNGWKPFNDPRYLSVIFEQGVISMSGNVSYVDLGSKVRWPRPGTGMASGARLPSRARRSLAASGRICHERASGPIRSHEPTCAGLCLCRPRWAADCRRRAMPSRRGIERSLPAGRLPRRHLRLRPRTARAVRQRHRRRGEATTRHVHDAVGD